VFERGVIAGRSDVPLSATGQRQMRAVAGWLADKLLNIVYSSSLQRAALPAAELAAARGLSYVVVPEFCEIDFGALEGKRYEDVLKEDPEFLTRAAERGTDFTLPEGENVGAFRRRAQKAFYEIVCAGSLPAVVYAHGGSIRAMISAVTGTSFSDAQKLSLSPGGITILERRGERTSLVTLNCVEHLR
jgi:broad specificity phosphatase PhoE